MDAFGQELEQLRQAHATARPSARLAAIRQRLAQAAAEPASSRLITLLSAIEALSRSLVAYAPGRPPATAPIRYRQVREQPLLEGVEEALKRHGAAPAGDTFGAGTWQQFEAAHALRELLVHECAQLAPDRYPPLIAAAEQVLEGLVVAGGLLRVVGVPAVRQG